MIKLNYKLPDHSSTCLRKWMKLEGGDVDESGLGPSNTPYKLKQNKPWMRSW